MKIFVLFLVILLFVVACTQTAPVKPVPVIVVPTPPPSVSADPGIQEIEDTINEIDSEDFDTLSKDLESVGDW